MDPLTLQAFGLLATGLGLSSVAGLRAYFPLLALAVGSDVATSGGSHLVTLSKPFQQLGQPWIVALLVLLALGEFTVDKLPIIDHISDFAHTFIRPISGAIIMAATANPLSNMGTGGMIVAAVIGGGLALTVHAVKATARPAVTATTAGIGNPIVSFIEDIATGVVAVLAVLAPVVAVILVAVLGFFGFRLIRKAVRAFRARRAAATVSAGGSGFWRTPTRV